VRKPFLEVKAMKTMHRYRCREFWPGLTTEGVDARQVCSESRQVLTGKAMGAMGGSDIAENKRESQP